MSNVPTNLIPTLISRLPEYTGNSTGGYLPYVYDGRTYKVLFSNIAAVGAVPSSRIVGSGNGLTGGGDLSQDRIISIIAHGVGFGQLDFTGVVAGTYGDAGTIPVVTVDATGRVSAVTNTPIVLANYVPTTRTVSAGAGLTGGGQLTGNITLSLNPSSATPQALGAATAGTGVLASRDDHVHPAVNLTSSTETQGVLPLGRGGTGIALTPVAGAVIYADNDSLNQTTAGNAGQILTSAGGASAPYWQTVTGTGSVTSVSVVSANGFAGTVATPSTTPAITLTTSVSGILKGDGTALAAASAGTDYVAPGAYTTSGLTLATSRLLGRTTAGTGAAETITVGSGLSFATGALSNAAPDQTVVLTAGTNVSITGTYPSFTINAAGGGGSGTVTSVGLSGGTTGLTATSSTTNPITTSGTFTLGGTLGVANGGTNSTGTPPAGGVAYGTGTAIVVNAAGPAGYVLTSGGAAPPVWTPVASLAVGTEAYWGSFWDTTTQTAATINTAYTLTLNSADVENNGVTVVSGSRVTFIHAGVYSLTFSVQLTNTDNANAAHIANIWIRKNGTDVIATDSKFTVPGKFGSVQGAVIGTVNFVLPIAANDYIQLVWSTDDTSLAVASFPAGTTPVSPVVPSVIFTAVAAAPVGLGYAGVVSVTSLTISTGSKVLTVNTNATDTAFIVGNRVRLVNSAVNYMDGVITAYSSTSMTVLVDGIAGSGTYTSWAVSLTGSVGGVTSFSGNSTGLTPATATTGAISLAGTLNVLNGGTGASTLSSGYHLKGNGTSAVSASIIYETGTFAGFNNSTPQATIDLGPTTNQAVFLYNGSGDRYGLEARAQDSGSYGLNLFSGYDGPIRFRTSGASFTPVTRMTIGSTGNVGIGNVPSGTYKLEVTGAAYASSMALGAALPVASGGTGATTLTGLVVGNAAAAFTTVAAPAGVVVGTSDTQTLTNKNITARVNSQTTTASPWAWNSNNYDVQAFTALANALTINADAGTPTDGQRTILRFKDNGTAQGLTWTTGASKAFRAVGVTLPTTTVSGKTVYVGCLYNTADSRWDVVAVSQEA